MAVVSIDLAYRNYKDIGVAVMRNDPDCIDVRLQKVSLTGDPKPDVLAVYCAELASRIGASHILIDGPQGWKNPDNGLIHSRICERALNTPAKTGLPGVVKPANYLAFVAFSIAFFDELARLGWERLLSMAKGATTTAIETFPLSAWRALTLPPLPAKARCAETLLLHRTSSLQALFPLRLSAPPTHDELQAVVSGLGGLAFEAQNASEYCVAGVAPFVLDGTQREGFILNPLRRVRGDA
jgi:hypothetical protein